MTQQNKSMMLYFGVCFMLGELGAGINLTLRHIYGYSYGSGVFSYNSLILTLVGSIVLIKSRYRSGVDFMMILEMLAISMGFVISMTRLEVSIRYMLIEGLISVGFARWIGPMAVLITLICLGILDVKFWQTSVRPSLLKNRHR